MKSSGKTIADKSGSRMETTIGTNGKYNPSETETRWKEVWEKEKIYSPNLETAKKPFYNLMMFPYPSAEGMHVGNMYAFVGSDIYGRFQRMQGNDVFEPIGLDGFGIHSENYAIKVGRHPIEQAKISEKNYYRQLHAIGNGFDWPRTVETYKPEYYKWTQWIFIQLFKAGLAYRKKAPVNFCPSCKTVLADEQVVKGQGNVGKTRHDVYGKESDSGQARMTEESNVCERCGTEVEKRNLEQWFFKITKYADRLLNNIDKLDWSEKVKIAQRQWIGKSEGAKINFEINNNENYILLHGFTGSPDVNFFPWLKNELEKKEHKVYAPQLPNTNDPDINEQVESILKNASFDENTVLFGHSLGCVVALKIVEKLKKPIKKLVLAAGFAQPKFLDHPRPFEKKFDRNFDFEKIKKNVKEVVLLRAENDTAVPQERSDYIKSKIGGTIIDFVAEDDHICGTQEPVVLKNLISSVGVFTTRPDTLFGATFLVLSPEHPIVASLLKGEFEAARPGLAKLKGYVDGAEKKREQERTVEGKDKTGVFTGLYAINPVNNEKISVWVADYVLMGYGTGAIMAVPAHDQRDFEFAKKFEIPIKTVILNEVKDLDSSAVPQNDKMKEAYVGEGKIINSEDWNGWKTPDSIEKVIEWLERKGLGKKEANFHLRDWLISRQRYWGPPIPLVFCENCAQRINDKGLMIKDEFSKGEMENPGWIAVKEKDLPVELPFIEDYKPLGTGQAPLASHPEFYKTRCPNCEGEARRETDVSDTFLDSSWYFLRYIATEFDNIPFPTNVILNSFQDLGSSGPKMLKQVQHDIGERKRWLPVDMYIGGAEHSVLHLLYSRFITMVLKDLGLIGFEEPFTRFRAHGLIVKDGAKMSKSKGNVVIPDAYIKKFGADTLRTYLMFMGPFNQGGDFRDSGIEGMHRFLRRVWNLAQKSISNSKLLISNEGKGVMNKAIKKVTKDVVNLSYNTAIAGLMEYYNFLSNQKEVSKEEIEAFLKLLAPFAPHVTEELWFGLGNKASIHKSQWPSYDERYLVSDEVVVAVQVNGKLRGALKIKSEKLKVKSYIEQLAQQSDKVKKHLDRTTIKKVIYVEGKVINFVVS